MGTHPGTGFQSIPGYVKTVVSNGKPTLLNPLEVSHQIHAHSDKALQLAAQQKAGGNKALSNTLADNSTGTLPRDRRQKASGRSSGSAHQSTGLLAEIPPECIDWVKLTDEVKNDIEIAKKGH